MRRKDLAVSLEQAHAELARQADTLAVLMRRFDELSAKAARPRKAAKKAT